MDIPKIYIPIDEIAELTRIEIRDEITKHESLPLANQDQAYIRVCNKILDLNNPVEFPKFSFYVVDDFEVSQQYKDFAEALDYFDINYVSHY